MQRWPAAARRVLHAAQRRARGDHTGGDDRHTFNLEDALNLNSPDGPFSSKIDWGINHTPHVVEHTRVQEAPKHKAKPPPKRPPYLAQPMDMPFERAVKEIDLLGAPNGLQTLLACADAPPPLQVYRAVVARHRRMKVRDHPLSMLLNACKRRISAIPANRPRDRAVELNQAKTLFYEALGNGHDVGVLANTAIIQCCCAANKPEFAEKTLKKMKQIGMKVPPQVYTSLISAKCNALEPDKGGAALEGAWAIFEEMVNTSAFDEDDRAGIETALGYAAAALINGAVKVKAVEDAEKVWKLVVEKWNVPPNVYLYTNYMRALAVAKRQTPALDLYYEMKTKGIAPNTHTFGALLGCFGGDYEDIEQAEALFQEMVEADLKPNIVVFTLLLQIYQKQGDVVGMKSVYRRLRHAGLHPTSHTWNVILSACTKATKNPNDAYALLILGVWAKARDGVLVKRDAPRAPTPPPHTLHPFLVPLLRVLANHQEREAVVDVVAYMKQHNVLFKKGSFQPATAALRAVGAMEELEQITQESEEKLRNHELRMKESTRPRHAATRSSLLGSNDR